MSPDNQPRTRVIVFLLVGFAVFVLTIALLGRSQNIFSRKVSLFTTFTNVSGLAVGAPVRLAGVDVGLVRKIEFTADKDKKMKGVKVELGVERSALRHIREDSIAQLASKGLLGDMLVNITLGDSEKRQLEDGDTLQAQEAIGLSQVVESVEVAISNIKNLTTNVDKRIEETLTPEFSRNLARIVASIAGVTERIERGPGAAHALIYDPGMQDNITAAVGDARGAIAKVAQTVEHLEAMIAEAQTGDGMLHALVYEKGGGKTVRELGRVATELADAVQQIRTGNGMLHSLIYEKDKTNLVQDLAHAAKVVRGVADEVNQGKGTIGGLLKDPTVYQDLKAVLGNIKRNLLLKAVIRMTIDKDELKRTGDVKE